MSGVVHSSRSRFKMILDDKAAWSERSVYKQTVPGLISERPRLLRTFGLYSVLKWLGYGLGWASFMLGYLGPL